MTQWPWRTRRTGGALLAFGAAGVGLLLAAAGLVLGSLSTVDDAVTGFERQRTELVALLEPASNALDDAATSATNASGSLTQAAAAADLAAQLTSRLAASFEGLSSLGGFEILGSRPFDGLTDQFNGVASDARSLSVDLAATAGSLRANVADSSAVAADLRSLAAQLDRLRASVSGESGGASGLGAAGLPIAAARIVLLGMLAWLAVPAVASIWLGWRLRRRARPPTARPR